MKSSFRKKILIIDSSIAFSGAIRSVIEQTKLLTGKYDFIFVISTNSTAINMISEEGNKVYELPMIEVNRSFKNIILYIPVLVINYFRLRRIVKKESVDIIQVNDFYNLLGASMKIFGFKGKLITYIRFLPSTLPKVLTAIWTWIAQKFSYRVVCVSDAVLNQLPKKDNIVRIYNSLCLDEKYNEIVSEDNETIRLLYLANYIPGKGHAYALEAFALAYKQNQKLRLKFVGGDMNLEKNKNKKSSLMKRSEKLNLKKVVEFDDFHKDVERVIKESDIVLNFSIAESFSMTCVEASFFGKPVIATRCGGPEEIIVHNQTGLLVEKKDINDMASAIVILANDRVKRTQFGLAGRKYVREKFSERKFFEEMKEIFE